MSKDKDIENIFKRIEDVLSTVERLVNEKGGKKEEKKLEKLKEKYESIKKNQSKTAAIELTKTIRDVIVKLEQKGETSKQKPKTGDTIQPKKEAGLSKDLKISSPTTLERQEESARMQEKENIQDEEFQEFTEGLDKIKDLIDDTLVIPENREIEGKSVSEADKIMGVIEKEEAPRGDIEGVTSESFKKLEQELNEFKKEVQDQLKILTKRFEILKANIEEIYTKLYDETPKTSQKPQEEPKEEPEEEPIKEYAKSKEEVQAIFNEKIEAIKEFLAREYTSPITKAIKAESLHISTRELIQSLPKKNIPAGQLRKMKNYMKRINSERDKIKQQVL